MWKIWTENPETNEAGGIYVFETKKAAENYLDCTPKGLGGFGIPEVNGKIFAIHEKLTAITNEPVN
ncbi:hypothetical protein GCM10009001_09160 [Virgibacillus siamensis]|uniref:Monooxygenase n=1 Tax=Virgibacillus siamensis TaxID=480071 RepID=A0ABP3QQ08_9BACI